MYFVRLRFELRLNLVRASGLLAMDCRFELLILKESIKTEALTIELADNTISLCFLSLDKAELCRFNVPSGFGTMLSHRTLTYGSNGSLRSRPRRTKPLNINALILSILLVAFSSFYFSSTQTRTVTCFVCFPYTTEDFQPITNPLFALIVELACAMA